MRGMENVNFTIFGLWFPCWFQSASYRRPALVGGIPGTPTVYRVTINRRLSDANDSYHGVTEKHGYVIG